MALVFLKLVKPCTVAALAGLVAVHLLTPLDAATLAVGVLWALLMIFL